MDERLYRFLKYTAIVMAIFWGGWEIYSHFFARSEPGDYAYQAGSKYFADGHYEQALKEYESALKKYESDPGVNPKYNHALRGRAETLIMLKQEYKALAIYDELIALEPDLAVNYAVRGLAHDRLGQHQKALADYQQAIKLDPEIGEGPGWLTRFLRNQQEKIPGIADRARYLQAQMELPESERVLSIPEQDEAQRPYKKN